MTQPHYRNKHPKYRKKCKIQNWKIDSITADKAYDQSRVYSAANDQLEEGGQINIHPRVNVIVSASDGAALRQRNQHVKSIDEDGDLT